MIENTNEILKWIDGRFGSRKGSPNLIEVLLAMQKRFGYLPKEALKDIASRLGITPANVFGVATFYNQFRFNPPGKYPIKVCMGTACHIKQGTKVLEHWERNLDIKEGEVTPDGEYSLDRVACVGCCALAPVTVIGQEVIGQMSPTKVDGLLLGHELQRKTNKQQPDQEGG